jgi:hypothetical protein
MNIGNIEEIADAVLYEGYILYPYRASALKNRKRFNFGVVYPSGYAEGQGGSASSLMQTECLVLAGPLAEIEIKVRLLQIVARVAGQVAEPLFDWGGDLPPGFRPVSAVEVAGKRFSTWQEAAERSLTFSPRKVAELCDDPTQLNFLFSAGEEFEGLRDECGFLVAGLTRRQEFLSGCVDITATRVNADAGKAGLESSAQSLYRLRVRISNLTPLEPGAEADEVLLRSLVSTHTLLGVRKGEFISLLDPPAAFKDASAACQNVGTFPVLAGERGSRDMVLSSPIILYDYPRVAGESAAQFFDGTEIDEMLALRIMTLTDGEKREMVQVDEKGRELLERMEAVPPEHLLKLHGVLRGLPPNESGEGNGR